MVPGGRGFRRFDRLGVRLVVLLGIALLPIGLIAITQTYRMLNEAEARTESALLGETVESAAHEREVILSALGAARALASLGPALSGDHEVCARSFREARDRLKGVALIALIQTDGTVACASEGTGRNLSARSSFRDYIANPEEAVSLLRTPAISREPVLLVRRPVLEGEEVTGYISLSLPVSGFTDDGRRFGDFTPVDIVIFTGDGEILNAESGLEDVQNRLPRNTALAALAGAEAIFEDVDRAGTRHAYTVAPLLENRVHVMAIWPAGVLGISRWSRATTVAFPFMMWLASLAVAYYAVHALVIRHIRALRRRIRIFTATRKIGDDTHLPDMPVELREVTEAFQSMTEQIIRDEAELENSLHEKDVLLREVHHRVKNNLQLIASMTNMQMRKTREPRTRSILRRLQDRVLGMAAVHRSLYETTSLSMVPADKVLREVANQLVQNSIPAGSRIRFAARFEPVNLYPDQALPLSLLLTEAMTNALKYLGRPPDGPPFVHVTLSRDGSSQVQLVVENTLGEHVGEMEDMESSGLGSQLIQAFTMQLGATLQYEETDDRFRLIVRFERVDFASVEDEDADAA